MTKAPPVHLSHEMQAWWRQLARRYRLQSHHYAVLTCAAEAWDRRSQARALLEVEGLVTINRFGEKRAHPAVSIERDARTAFLRAVRELALVDDDLPPDARPPRLGGYVDRTPGGAALRHGDEGSD